MRSSCKHRAAEARATRSSSSRKARAHGVDELSRYFREHGERLRIDLRVTRLGHVQRGGVPNAFDRLIATQLGAAAIERIADGAHGMLLGIVAGSVQATPLAQVVDASKTIDNRLVELANVLAR